jgi:putative DNA primase/helicase
LTVEELLDACEGVRSTPSGWKARCPAHEDRIQSLSVTVGGDDKMLVYCHAGCSFHEIMAALSEGGLGQPSLSLPESGIERRVGTLDTRPPSESPASLDGFAAIYDYEDENGKLLFKVCRTWDKRFFQARPDADSPTGFFWGLGATRRVPYRLPRVLRAVRAGETIYIVEGEKDVHAVERHGGVATCNPMGASKGKPKWRSEWNHYFEFGTVVVVPDLDEAGQEHARYVHDQLADCAAEIAYGWPRSGKDTYDHLKAGHALEELVAF